MSGGSMEYVYHRIAEAADYIQQTLASEKMRYCHGLHGDHKYEDGVIADQPGLDCLQDKTGKTTHREVIKLLGKALETVRSAAIYAEQIEWVTSGDDGWLDFLDETPKQVAESRKHGGVK